MAQRDSAEKTSKFGLDASSTQNENWSGERKRERYACSSNLIAQRQASSEILSLD
jgi:hypothetical protein